jgi:hypothetical protein
VPFERIFLLQNDGSRHEWADRLEREADELTVVSLESAEVRKLLDLPGEILIIDHRVVDLFGAGYVSSIAEGRGLSILIFHDGRPGWDLEHPGMQPHSEKVVVRYDNATAEGILTNFLDARR